MTSSPRCPDCGRPHPPLHAVLAALTTRLLEDTEDWDTDEGASGLLVVRLRGSARFAPNARLGRQAAHYGHKMSMMGDRPGDGRMHLRAG